MGRSTNLCGRSSPAIALSVCALAAVVVAPAAAGKPARRAGEADLSVRVDTPLGMQGLAGAASRVALPFRVFDRGGRKVTVEVQVGIDRDGDGLIADGSDPSHPSEYVPATQQRRDPRDTGRLRASRNGSVVTYRTARSGAAHAFVWDSLADLGAVRIVAGQQTLRDETGRAVEDPYEAGSTLLTDSLPGVRLRLRAVRGGKRGVRSAWQVTEGFSVNNASAPSVRIDSVPVIDDVAGRVEIDWTGFDADSEDANGNGVLDLLALEDANGNGVLDVARIAVHFDFYRLSDGEGVPASEVALENLRWTPCTRALGEGDPDTGIVVAPAPVGGVATFVWNVVSDLGPAEEAAGAYLLRATPYDESGALGRSAYYVTPFEIGAAR